MKRWPGSTIFPPRNILAGPSKKSPRNSGRRSRSACSRFLNRENPYSTLSGRERSEEELRISETRYLDLVKNSAYGIFRATVDGTIQDANPALLSILGCSCV